MRRDLGRRLRESTRVEWESLGLQIGHRYEGSPICVSDGTPPTSDEYSTYIPTTRPGARAPHVWLSDGRSTLDLFGRTFVLLCFDGGLRGEADTLAQAFAARGVPFRLESIEQADVARAYERPLVLVRPDGHVAWRGSHVEHPGQVADTVRGAA